MVVRVQVGHEHGGEGAQELVYFVPVVAAQLPEGALPAVQQQGHVGAMGGDGLPSGRRAGQGWVPVSRDRSVPPTGAAVKGMVVSHVHPRDTKYCRDVKCTERT